MADLTAPAVAGDLLVVPLGATEQHGPHLPLGTDTIIAAALVDELDAVIAPALPYGASGEHEGFPGTLSIGRAALEHVLVELGRSAPFDRLLFVSAHGGNAEAVAAAVTTLRAEGRDVRAWSPRWRSAAAPPPRSAAALPAAPDAHAGRTETSLMLALAPELVGPARERGNVAPLAELMPRLRAEGVRAVSPNGVLGDPTGASAAEGRALLAAARADLAAFVAAWRADGGAA
ncbi:MAG TPA: mycofactocin biosynthesis peptidyl-dipeptidase MftE [Solirubrobacter sp.]|nr:mycofactocin biosynthesis peptidyl-dipeptidase MftE [Solirubrobacter sp.]